MPLGKVIALPGGKASKKPAFAITSLELHGFVLLGQVVEHKEASSLIRLGSGELCYITQRIDGKKEGTKIHIIDFLQILELEDKYMGTMEHLGKKIGELSTNTLVDKLRFFELTVFNYIIGNNDMHFH